MTSNDGNREGGYYPCFDKSGAFGIRIGGTFVGFCWFWFS